MKQKRISPIKSGFAPLLIILLIVVLGVVVYLGYKNFRPKIQVSPVPAVNPTPIDMSNWKIYQSDKMKISFEYPKDWFIKVDESTVPCTVVSNKPITIPQNGINTKDYFEIGVCQPGGKLPTKDNFPPYDNNAKTNPTIQNVIVSSHIGLRGKVVSAYGEEDLILIDDNNADIQVDSFPANNLYFNQILSTFQFTK